jgi:MFS transporter, ACS family, hexuronate transporter
MSTTTQANPLSRAELASTSIPWRWVAMSVFVLSDSLNFLDRQLIAAVAPALKSEFHLSNAQFGAVISAFSLVYMFAAPIAGMLVDRFGMNRSVILGVTGWSLAGCATGFVQSFRGLVACRMALGLSETAGIPSGSKAIGMYLRPRELGLGLAFNSLGFTFGAILAPLVVAVLTPRYGWRSAFLFCGVLGLIWVPLWMFTSRRIRPEGQGRVSEPVPFRELLHDRRLWILAFANILIMTPHSLWFNWTTIYFVQQHHLTQLEANTYFAWIPPIFGTLGGFFGGWLALRWIRNGGAPVWSRLRISRVSAPLLLMVAIIPFIHSTVLAAAAISLSFFLVMTILSNLHAVPIDLFGVKHAAFTASVLAFSYALLQAVFSPVVGYLVDNFGFAAVCIGISGLPFLGISLVRLSLKEASRQTAKAFALK